MLFTLKFWSFTPEFRLLTPKLSQFNLTIRSFIPQRRVPFMERPGGSHWLECSHLLILLVWKNCPYYADRFQGVLFPQRRGSLKNLTEGSLLFECSLSFILLISKFYPPTTQTFRCLIPQRRVNSSSGSHW